MIDDVEYHKKTFQMMSHDELVAECLSLYELNKSLKSTIAERDCEVSALSYYIKRLDASNISQHDSGKRY